MSRTHKDLPGGSQSWAEDVTGYRARIDELEAIVRRMANDFGLDYSNPTRGLNTGNTPSVQKNVELKLPSLKDLEIRDAQDGDLLTFDGKRGVWVARRHNTVQLPKVFPQGDPASYYVAPIVPPANSIVLADTWSNTFTGRNLFTDPDLNSSVTGMVGQSWTIAAGETGIPSYDITSITNASGHTEVAINFTSADSTGQNYIELDNLPPDVRLFTGIATLRDLVVPAGADQPTLLPSVAAQLTWFDASDQAVEQRQYKYTDLSQTSLDWVQFTTQPTDAFNTGGVAVRARLKIVLVMPWRGGSGTFLLDNLFLTNASPVFHNASSYSDYFFSGNSASTTEVAFSWDGAASASTSTARTLQRLKIPAQIPRSSTFQVLGEGFLPADTVTVEFYQGNTYLSQQLTASTTGTFETTFTSSDDPATSGSMDAYAQSSLLSQTPNINFTIPA